MLFFRAMAGLQQCPAFTGDSHEQEQSFQPFAADQLRRTGCSTGCRVRMFLRPAARGYQEPGVGDSGPVLILEFETRDFKFRVFDAIGLFIHPGTLALPRGLALR